MKEEYQTLGDNVRPVNYNLLFETDMNAFKFKGTERIKIKVRKGTNVIRLNAVELQILWASIKSGSKVQRAKVSENKRRNELLLKFPKRVMGDALIEIRFVGSNNDKMYGFYRSRCSTNPKDGYILTSQFEAADARAAFPCFDEPAFKATFDVSMAVDKDQEAVSNMPIKSVKAQGKRKLVTFNTTPRMSSYLLYLGVGRYDSVEGEEGKIKLRVMCVPGKKKLARLALNYSKKFIRFFEGYFGIRYPLPKIDFLAIPDFSAGAMENWGAITFREVAILADEKLTPIAVKQQIAETIAHELAHQWFGDLVTMKWWNDLWLNESFATFMANKALDHVFPEWNMKEQYFDDVIATAFAADPLKSTHPISVHVSTPEEVDQIFDSISYDKGGTVLHMIETYVGAENFRKGLHTYLKSHAYGNAEKQDLWGAIDGTAGRQSAITASEFASSWVNQPGYPIVEVATDMAGRITVRQRRFLIVDYGSGRAERWPVPIPYVSKGGKRGEIMLIKESATMPHNSEGWVKLNYGQDYLYRVRYPSQMLQELGSGIKAKRIKGPDAWGIESDLFALARSGRIPAEEYFSFIESYCLDPDHPLSFSISSHLGWLRTMLEGTKAVKRAKEVGVKYHLGILHRLGWGKKRGEKSLDTMLRSMTILSLGQMGHAPTISRTLALFSAYLKTKKLDPDLKGAVYAIAAWTGDQRMYSKMVSLYKKEEMPDDKRRLLQSIGLFRDPKLIRGALRFAFSKDVRLQDSFLLPAIISSNPVGRRMIWGWTRGNWPFLMKTYDSGTHMLERFVTNLAGISSEEERSQIASFYKRSRNRRGDINLRIRQSIEKIEANINFLRKNS